MIYLELFLTFLKIGAFTFGGGYAMLPLIQDEVEAHGWLTSTELVDFIAVSESTPGLFGAFCSTFGVVLPSFVIILIVARCYEKFRESRAVKGCMSGLKPAVVGLIAAAAVTTGQTVFFPLGISAGVFTSPAFLCSAVIFVAMMLLAVKKLHPILIIIISAVLGIAAGYAFQL